MLNGCPLLLLNSILYGCFGIVNADSDDPNLVLPSLCVFREHVLVVLHWLLTGTTPGSPDINEEDFSRLVLKQHLLVASNLLDLSKAWEFIPFFQAEREIEVGIVIIVLTTFGRTFGLKALLDFLEFGNFVDVASTRSL